MFDSLYDLRGFLERYDTALLLGAVLFAAASVAVRYLMPRRSARIRRKAAARAYATLQEIAHDGQRFSYLRKLDPFVFEELVLTAYQKRGHAIRRNKRYTGDGGIDGQVQLDGNWHIIQAKRYSSAINPQHVAELALLCARRQCKGLFIHTGRTGDMSRKALGSDVQIISGSQLLTLLRSSQLANTIGRCEQTSQAA